jgi:hypothetical protein
MGAVVARCVVAVALAAAAGVGSAATSASADRPWRSGIWRAPSAAARPVAPVRGARTYAIEGDGVRLEVEDVVPLGGQPLAVTLGKPVKYAVEKFIVYVLDSRGAERTMRLLSSTASGPPQESADKGEPRYPSMGSGHFVKSVRDEGRFVTLEDNSVWEIEPTGRYLTAEWEVQAGIAVRYSGGDDGFVYEIDNVDTDDGALARWLRPQQAR